ncbi:secA [Symbiodinium sp. CCMP2456]|nr:secA [Symbiodinium sp. CCMP2456]
MEAQEEHGIDVPQVIIVDMATGTESVGTRWTSEASAVHALPVGGSDPLALFNSIPPLANKYGWVGGVTGTLGQSHCFDFYAKVYNSRCSFQLPRNVPGCIYQLRPIISRSSAQWLRNIEKYILSCTSTEICSRASRPVLVITETILKAEQVSNHLKAAGYPIMKQNREGRWSHEGGTATNSAAHVFPYVKSSPDASIVVASNKGGRGLDLLDGRCPPG